MGEIDRRVTGPRVVHTETMCCGYKKCPTVHQFDDGSVEITDDDAETGSVGTIKLQPEQARRLAALIDGMKL
ncbi:MAG TPA: hypothetical protein VMU14_19635 [Acidimicrobiales bacterium]|nr:hypothetical protein [Acidimicrobiales bacterium]